MPEKDGVAFAPPDGICLDAEGAVWVADPIGARVFRVAEGGDVTDSIAFDGVIPVACVLGGDDRRTLFMCVAADWKRDIVTASRTGRIDACTVRVPGQAGRDLRVAHLHRAPGPDGALQARFRDHTCALFEKHGMTNVGYWVNAIGGRSDELWYILGYEDLAAAGRMGRVRADPEWQRVAAESEADGPIVHHIENRMLPTDFSPLGDHRTGQRRRADRAARCCRRGHADHEP